MGLQLPKFRNRYETAWVEHSLRAFRKKLFCFQEFEIVINGDQTSIKQPMSCSRESQTVSD